MSEWRVYSTLNGTSDYDLYRIRHTSGSWLNITVTSRSGTDVDFYLQNATDPSSIGNNPGAYAVQRNGTNTTEWYRWENIEWGTVFSLLIRHKNATNTAYSITYARETASEPDPPECNQVIGNETIQNDGVCLEEIQNQ